MLEKCRGIVFNTVDYSDSSVILKCYTDRFGLQSFMINGVRGKKGNIRPSHLMPLNLLEMDVYHQQNKNLQRIRELKCIPSLHALQFELNKRTVALFLSELLVRTIREEDHHDPELFEFLTSTIQILDLCAGSVGNFPACFMIQLSKFLGFYPKSNYHTRQSSFSISEGEFVTEGPEADTVTGEPAKAIARFVETGFTNWQEPLLSLEQRRYLLTKLIRYYQHHRILSGDLRSPSILHEVLG